MTGFWVWFVVWSVLIVSGGFFLLNVLATLYRTALGLGTELSKFLEQIAPLVSTDSSKVEPAVPASVIADDPEVSLLRVQANRKARLQRKRDRANRLLADLKLKRWEKP